MGTGIARGFLAALDAAWMIRSWSQGGSPLDVLAERSVYTVIIFSIWCTVIHNLSLLLSVSLAVCLFLSISQREYIPAPPSDDSREPSKELWSVYSRSNNQIPEHQLPAHHACSGTIIDICSFIQRQRHPVPHLIYVLQVRHLVDTGEEAGLNTDCDIIRLPSPRTLREGEFFHLVLSDGIGLLSLMWLVLCLVLFDVIGPLSRPLWCDWSSVSSSLMWLVLCLVLSDRCVLSVQSAADLVSGADSWLPWRVGYGPDYFLEERPRSVCSDSSISARPHVNLQQQSADNKKIQTIKQDNKYFLLRPHGSQIWLSGLPDSLSVLTFSFLFLSVWLPVWPQRLWLPGWVFIGRKHLARLWCGWTRVWDFSSDDGWRNVICRRTRLSVDGDVPESVLPAAPGHAAPC